MFVEYIPWETLVYIFPLSSRVITFVFFLTYYLYNMVLCFLFYAKKKKKKKKKVVPAFGELI